MKSIESSQDSKREIGREVAQLVQIACIWEVCAPKPGNVNRSHGFNDTGLEDFITSAIAIGPAFENAAQTGVGQIIRAATADTRRWVQSNTNLGIILLFAPLVKACLSATGIKSKADLHQPHLENIRKSLKAVLNSLTVEDARHAYAAIRSVQPGGLGRVSQADIAEEPSLTLLQAMSLAQRRDAVASEYVTSFAITFETGLPALNAAMEKEMDFSGAVVQAFLTILSRVPDTLIARKKGLETARQVSQKASEVLNRGGIFTPQGRTGLEEMDRKLRDKAHSLNPGTTADLTAAAIFLYLMNNPHPKGTQKQ